MFRESLTRLTLVLWSGLLLSGCTSRQADNPAGSIPAGSIPAGSIPVANTTDFTMLMLTMNGASGSEFHVAGNLPLVVSADIFDANRVVEKSGAELGKQAVLSVLVRDTSTSKIVTQTTLTPRLRHETGGKPAQPGVHRLGARFGGLAEGEYSLEIVIMERQPDGGVVAGEMRYRMRNVATTRLTVTKEEQP